MHAFVFHYYYDIFCFPYTGVCVGVMWDSGISYITWYVTDSQYQKRGIGSCIFQHVLRELENSNVVLDAVHGMEPIYQIHGFSRRKVIKTWKWSLGLPHHTKQSDIVGSGNTIIKDYSDDIFDALLQFDKTLGFEERLSFWQIWLTSPSSTVRIAIESGKCLGLIVGRTTPNTKFVRIAPLYAQSNVIASLLLQEIISIFEGKHQRCYICFPDFMEEKVTDVLYSIGITQNINTDPDEVTMSQKPLQIRHKEYIYGVCVDSVCVV